MKVLVPILRPDQGFHVSTAVNLGIALASIGSNVDFVFCDMDNHYCPVHIYNGDTLFDKCGSCRSSVSEMSEFITEHIKQKQLSQYIQLIYLSNFISTPTDHSLYTSDNIASIHDEAISFSASNVSYDIEVRPTQPFSFNNFVLPPYYSESFSNERLTFEDLFDYTNVSMSVAKSLLISRLIKNKEYSNRVEHAFTQLLSVTSYDLCLLWNGRYAAQKSMLRLARANNIRVKIHEIGFLNNTLSLIDSYSMDEHITAKSLFLDLNWTTRSMISPDLSSTITKSDYLTPKLTASSNAHSYYASPINLCSSSLLPHHQTSNLFCIFLSSPDELSSTYPFDFTQLERNTVLSLIPHISSDIIVRFHPRSVNSLLKAKLYNGVYWRFYLRLLELKNNHPHNIYIYPPSSPLSSYEIIRTKPYASLALFNTMAAELTAFGLTSISHNLSRLSSYSTHHLHSLNAVEAVSDILTVLSSNRNTYPDIVEMRTLFRAYLSDIADRSLPLQDGTTDTSSVPDYWLLLAQSLLPSD